MPGLEAPQQGQRWVCKGSIVARLCAILLDAMALPLELTQPLLILAANAPLLLRQQRPGDGHDSVATAPASMGIWSAPVIACRLLSSVTPTPHHAVGYAYRMLSCGRRHDQNSCSMLCAPCIPGRTEQSETSQEGALRERVTIRVLHFQQVRNSSVARY